MRFHFIPKMLRVKLFVFSLNAIRYISMKYDLKWRKKGYLRRKEPMCCYIAKDLRGENQVKMTGLIPCNAAAASCGLLWPGTVLGSPSTPKSDILDDIMNRELICFFLDYHGQTLVESGADAEDVALDVLMEYFYGSSTIPVGSPWRVNYFELLQMEQEIKFRYSHSS
jgi:hypothetical protein